MKKLLLVTIAAILTGCAPVQTQKASVTLEIRPGSQLPGPGLTEMTVPGSGIPVYVWNNVVLSNVDIQSARVVSGADGPQIELAFTEDGARRFSEATGNSIMQPLAILVDGQLISAPIVREKIRSGKAIIAGNFTKEEAARIANGIVDR